MSSLPKFDRMFHQAVRTRLAALLYREASSFSDLKAALAITDGNLDAHLRKLSGAGYLQSEMKVEGRPRTVYSLSPSGVDAFEDYLDALDELLELTRPLP
ncbi:MAG: transcriptional regulator [Pseudomonadota bacterium]